MKRTGTGKKFSASIFTGLTIAVTALCLSVTACNIGGDNNEDSQVNGRNVNLSALTINEGTMAPKFSPDDTSYNLEIPYANKSVTITATLSDPDGTMEINGTVTKSGQSVTIPLATTSTDITIRVIAPDNTTTKTYSLTVFRAEISHNADLASLEVSDATLTPGFSANTTSYTAAVPYSTGDVDVTAIPAGVGATVSIKIGSIFNSNGTKTVTVTVTAQDSITKKTYTIVINRNGADANANLADLTMASGTLIPEFSADQTSYTADVAYNVKSITVRPTASFKYATVKVNGKAVDSGESSDPVNLAVGSNTITVEVTAENGTTAKTYTITVNRKDASVNTNLSGLVVTPGTLLPEFTQNQTEYKVSVPDEVTSISIIATVSSASSLITINGTQAVSGTPFTVNNLALGENIISVAVSADGDTRVYTVTVSRKYTCDGVLDTQFGNNGSAPIVIGDNTITVFCSALQSDGKIVVGGQAYNNTTQKYDSAVARYNSDGTIDTTFGTGGLATGIGKDVQILSIAINTDGSIIAAGGRNVTEASIIKYTRSGVVDISFGNAGIVTTSIGLTKEDPFYPYRKAWDFSDYISLAIQNDGKILATGILYNTYYDHSTIVIERYNINGTPDTTFDTDGKATTVVTNGNFRIKCIYLQNDNKILVGGMELITGDKIFLTRYNTDGSTDATFGTSGMVSIKIGGSSQINTVSQQSDGRIIAAGYSFSFDKTGTIIRLNKNGTLDTTFGTSGSVFTPGSQNIFSIIVQPDDKLIVSGENHISRYNADGSIDTTFATNGKYTTTDYIASLLMLPDLTVIGAGQSIIKLK